MSLLLTVIAAVIISTVVLRFKHQQAQQKEEEAFAAQHDCEPLQPWIAKWPLGLDFLVKAFWNVRNCTMLDFFYENGMLCPTTHAQKVLFERGIGTIDPENVEAILSKQFDDFHLGIRGDQFADVLGSSIFTQDGAAWKHSRNLLRPQFQSNRFQNFEQIKSSVDSMLDELPRDGAVDLQPRFFSLTLDTTLFLVFGENASYVRSDDTRNLPVEFAQAFNDAQQYLTWRVRIGGLYRLINSPHYWRTCRKVKQFMEELVERALKADKTSDTRNSEDEPYVFIDALVKETRDKTILRDQCLSLLLAGRDTTACCLTWALRLLVRHPRVLEKLRTEIAATMSAGRETDQPTRDDLSRMQYLKVVVKEVLRLYPSVPVNVRAAAKLTTLPMGGGPQGKSPVMVRKGTGITWVPYVMHRRKDIYGEDALEFRPERWERDQLRDVGYGYLPFNAGPRICLGQDFALLEVHYTLVRLLQRIPSLTLPESETVGEIRKEKQLMGLVLSCAEGCWVHCRKTAL